MATPRLPGFQVPFTVPRPSWYTTEKATSAAEPSCNTGYQVMAPSRVHACNPCWVQAAGGMRASILGLSVSAGMSAGMRHHATCPLT